MSIFVELGKSVQLDCCTVLLQLYDNSVFQVGGPGGLRNLPKPDGTGVYHMTGTLQVADKTGVKEMTSVLLSLIRAFGQSKKAFLAPLTRYWLKPYCDDPLHHTNYLAATYLPALGASVFRLRDSIRDDLYTKRCSNFRVVCTNKLIGIGLDLSDDAAKVISQMLGTDPVHPSPAAYKTLACTIERDVLTDDVKYINAPKAQGGTIAKRLRTDLSRTRQGWVTGCSAAVPRRNTAQPSRGPGGRGSVGHSSVGAAEAGTGRPDAATPGGGAGKTNKASPDPI
jgi:hypothetical protein